MKQLLHLDYLDMYKEYEVLASLLIMLLLLWPFIRFFKAFITPPIKKALESRMPNYGRIFENNKLYRQFIKLSVLIYFISWSEFIDHIEDTHRLFLRAKGVTLQIYIIITISSVIISLLNIFSDVYRKKSASLKAPIGLYTQIIKIAIIICTTLSVVSTVLGLSISALFASLGAAAAVLTFVFKDVVTALIASIQVTAQDIIRIGDWVTVPNKNVDGNVERITITIVVIRNFDGTTTTVPTAIFLQNSIINWRPMYEAGGRRIKRSLSLDMDFVKVCDSESLNVIKSLPVMSDSVNNNPELFDPINETTNITLFRNYINAYLKSHEDIHKDGFTFLVRQLDPTPTGIPIELYIFTKDTRWVEHEEIQASIFEHLIGVLPKFKLKPFQTVVSHKK
ncbi:MAG: hypothetical protein DGJ47_000475 [Rickettsiaceae bacterium]